jgi:hypothetical protein
MESPFARENIRRSVKQSARQKPDETPPMLRSLKYSAHDGKQSM